MMMDRVVDLVTAQQVVVIIADDVGRLFPFISRRRCLVSGVLNMRENKPNSGSDCSFPVRNPPLKPSGSGM